jgi:16S rRNA processing protein RimM
MPSPSTADDELVELAAVVRAHGLRGELVLKPFNPESDLLREVPHVLLKGADGSVSTHKVRGARGHREHVILALDDVCDRDAAEALRGSLVCVLRRDLPELGEGEYYLIDLLGLEVRDQQDRLLGRVEDVLQYPSVSCLHVVGDDGAWEIPDTDRYLVEVDLQAGVVRVDHVDELDVLHTKRGEGRR